MMKAYHFLREDMTAGRGKEPAWVIGEERTHEGDIVICNSGYHSSPSWYDVLLYAPGPMACIVEVSKPLVKHDDKQVSRTRKLIAVRDANFVLREFACDCAERALKKSKVTDERSWNALGVSRAFNRGGAAKKELNAARDAARAAAWYAARAAARDAAWAAAMDAAWIAAWYAARAAAMAAARDAAWAAAMDAAWYAARDAEIRWQKRRLNWYMKDLFKAMEEANPKLAQNMSSFDNARFEAMEE